MAAVATSTKRQKSRVQVTNLPGRPAGPCPACNGLFFWFSRYDATLATPRCCDCNPAPIPSLAAAPLWGIVGPPGGPWWWESLGEPDARVSTEPVAGAKEAEDRGGDNRKLIEHTHHGHRLITVVGSGSVAGCRDNWKKCLVFCWGDDGDGNGKGKDGAS